MGIFATLPAFGIYYGAYRLLIKRPKPEFVIKLILIPLSIAGILASLYFFGGVAMLSPGNRDGFLLTAVYCLAALFFGLFFTGLPNHDVKLPYSP